MALRLIEAFVPKTEKDQVQEILKDHKVLGIWQEEVSENQVLVRILLSSEETEAVLDIIEKYFSTSEGFRIILLSVEASIPRPEPEEKVLPENEKPVEEQKPEPKIAVSREELYEDIGETIKLSWVFIVLVILSSTVAAIGLLRDNVAVIIGAMVIAPLLGPNVALSLATTLGDVDLARRAIKAGLIGILVALIFTILLGFFLEVDPNTPAIASRTKVGLEDIVLALASGSAATISFTTALPSTLIGVMVAVALLPPLVTLGILLGAGYWKMAIGAMLLVFTNLICINLAGVITFFSQGIRPLKWWEADKAKKATRIAIISWTVILLLLAVVIVLSKKAFR
jgi:uncharacterized hydrophobic protein (TIGR00341 family)